MGKTVFASFAFIQLTADRMKPFDHLLCLFPHIVDQRYKALHKYEYLYETESLNAINGASNLQNGPKASCKVRLHPAIVFLLLP